METAKEIPLTSEEIKLVKDLQKLAKRWKTHGKDLWLYSASGRLWVMMRGDTERNPFPEMHRTVGGGVNQDNCIELIDIPNDGGDW